MIRVGNEITITEEESKICKFDNKSFESSKQMIWHVRKTYGLSFEEYIINAFYNGQRPVCVRTGKSLVFKAHKLGPWFSNYSKNTFPRKPHTEESKERIKVGCEKTSMEKFGVKNVFSTEWCKEKIKHTIQEKYGVDNIMKLGEMKELFSTFHPTLESRLQSKHTSQEKYGVKHYSYSLKHKLQLRKTGYYRFYKNWNDYQVKLLENEQVKCISDNKIINSDLPLQFECILCNHKWVSDYLLMPECPKCREGFKNSRSMEEAALLSWLSNIITEKVTPNKRFVINGKTYEADVVIEDKKVIIELHGLWWHSERHGNKNRHYHIDKYNAFKSLGYDVFQIFEDEWVLKSSIVKRKLLHKLGYNKSLEKVYARKCDIKYITNKVSNEFLENTHLQGGTNAAYCYGAYYNDELVSVMTFSRLRKCMGNKSSDNDEYELVRFSTISNKIVIGIAGKFIKYFINQNNPKKIISYADRRWTIEEDNLYKSIGMMLEKITTPNYWYVRKLKREYRFKYTKKKLVKMGNDPNKTEWEIMQELGYDRIWDCGHLKYELIIT